MVIGVPREIMIDEARVGLTAAGVKELAAQGHRVLVETGAGEGSRLTDRDFRDAGAVVTKEVADVWAEAELIVKVKGPLSSEFPRFRAGQTLFCFLHLAANKRLAQALQQAKVSAIGYETVQLEGGQLPLLAPMSEIAGRLAPQAAAYFLEQPHGGRGVLLGGVAGVPPAKTVILGAGIVGTNAALVAAGLGAEVTVVEKDIDRLRHLEEIFYGRRILTMFSTAYQVEEVVAQADVVIGAVLIPGARAPQIVTSRMVRRMHQGSVIVDVSVDQGGCVETSEATTHEQPIITKYGVLHYGVVNMPAAVPRTATQALTNATLPWVLEMASRGLKEALVNQLPLARGVNVLDGLLVSEPVAEAHRLRHHPISELLAV